MTKAFGAETIFIRSVKPILTSKVLLVRSAGAGISLLPAEPCQTHQSLLLISAVCLSVREPNITNLNTYLSL